MKKLFLGLFYLLSVFSVSQNQANDSIKHSRKRAIIIGQSVLTTSAMIGLHELWYKNFEKSNFHFKNDSQHWLQMDKAGHLHSAYHLSRLSSDLINWGGLSKKNNHLYGLLYAQTFLTTIEVFDGYSKNWGFSWSDVSANMLGSGLYFTQEALWHEQRIIPKYSFHQTKFAKNRPEVLGSSFSEQLLKDYNGQTYWLSFNLKSFLKHEKIPNFLNVAFGFGAENMLTATKNDQINDERYRQFFFSFDIDFQRIKTNKQWLKTIFSLLNVVKIPFPTVEFSTKNDVKWHWIYY